MTAGDQPGSGKVTTLPSCRNSQMALTVGSEKEAQTWVPIPHFKDEEAEAQRG